MKRIFKITTDIFMLILFVYLMGYHHGMSIFIHGLLGIMLFALFIFHNILNINWYKAFFKGSYNFKRIFLMLLNILLLFSMLLMMISSIMISGRVFKQIGVSINYFYWRDIHSFMSGIGFIIMAFHLGFHLDSKLKRLEEKCIKALAYIAQLVVFIIGLYCFWISGLLNKIKIGYKSLDGLSNSQIYLCYIFVILAISILVHFILKLYDERRAKR